MASNSSQKFDKEVDQLMEHILLLIMVRRRKRREGDNKAVNKITTVLNLVQAPEVVKVIENRMIGCGKGIAKETVDKVMSLVDKALENKES